ncbi:uncharacterized protein LOC135351685 isoform X2 [Halichondria panicea]|uniref:uncharacterized protein LOC135351685 isoform X2 n=1 Tax=Halichondria panicea TaxID=6063 RepID=UPI00312B5D29
MQTKRQLVVLVLACSIVLFSQGARCSNFSLNVTLVTNSPLNCSTGLTYPGPAFVRVEYRWLEWVGSDDHDESAGDNELLMPGQWSTLRTMITYADYSVTGHTLRSSGQDNVDAVQLRIVQPEHGGGLCNCWEISKLLVTFDGNVDLTEESRCNDSQLTRNGAGTLQFCGGSAGEPRGVVFRPVGLNNGKCSKVVDGSALVDKQPPPMNCETSNPRIELSYVLDLTPDGCDPIDNNNEGIEVSLGNWDRDGTWIPLAYHNILFTNNPSKIRIRDYDVPYYNCSGVQSFRISVCGDDYLRDGLQIRWLQYVNLKTDKKRDVVTLDNVSISLIVNETSISLLEDGFDEGNLSSTNWNKEIRNGGVSTDCSGDSDGHKIVFGLNCTTFGCELNRTDASRIATTIPLNITQLLSSSEPFPNNQPNTTIVNICYPEQIINPTSMGATSTEEKVTSDITTAEEVTPTTSDMTTAEEVTSTTSDMTTAEEVTPTTSDMTTAEEVTTTTSDMTIAEEVTSTTSDMTTAEEVTPTTSDMTTAEEVTTTTSDMTIAEEVTSTTSDMTTAEEVRPTTSDMTTSDMTTVGEVTPTTSDMTTAEEVTLTISDMTTAEEVTTTISDMTTAEEVTPTTSDMTTAEELMPTTSDMTTSDMTTVGEVTPTTSDMTTAEEVTPTTSDMTTAEEVTTTTSDMTTAEEVTPTISDMTTAEEVTTTISDMTTAKEVMTTISYITTAEEVMTTTSDITTVGEVTPTTSDMTTAEEVTTTTSDMTTAEEVTPTISDMTTAEEVTTTISDMTTAEEVTTTISDMTTSDMTTAEEVMTTISDMTTAEDVMSTSSIQVASTAPSTSTSLAEELKSAISDTSSIINGSEKLRAIKKKPPSQAATSLRDFVRKGPKPVERRAVVYLLSDMVNRARGINDSQQFGQDVLEVSDNLLEQSLNTTQSSAIVGSTLLATIEQLAFNVLTPTKDGLRTSNIELIVQEVEQDGNDNSYFTGIETTNGSIRVPTELVRMMGNVTGPVTLASVYYRNMSGLLPGTLPGERDTVLASPVVSTSLQCGDKICDTANIKLSQPVIVTLKHSSQLAQDSGEMKCVFWEFKRGSDSRLINGRWNTRDCERNDSLSNSTHTVCECTHLTNFAILLSSQPIVGGVHAFVLEVIGYIGVSLSVLAMLATILALVYLRSLWSMRNYIHINLCVSLILAQLMFVSGVTPHGGGVVDPGCRTVAILMHYLFLVSFMWMLMEGVVLYVALVKVFVKNQKRYIMGFTIFSYGAPLLYMGLCVPLGFTLYPEADYGYGYVQVSNSTQDNETTTQQIAVCWLNPHGYFIQTFIVPVVLVILANIGFFIMALVIMNRHAKKQTHKNRIQRTKYWLKSSVSLVTIMGLTWIIGLLVFEVPALFPLAYIFTIFIAFQGVAIFVIFVPLSKQVREAYSKWWRVKVAESDILSSYFSDLSFRNNSSSASNGKTPSINQHSSPNIYELESNISKTTYESSVSLDTERFKTPDVTTPDYGFAFNITMRYPQGKSDQDVCIGNSGVQD